MNFRTLALVGLVGVIAGFVPKAGASIPPKETTLLAEIQAPIIADGKQIGSMKLPAGSSVTIVSVESDGVMVRRGEGTPFKIASTVIPADALAALQPQSQTPFPAPSPVTTPSPVPSPAAITRSTQAPVPTATPADPLKSDWDAGPVAGAALDQAKFRWWAPPGEKNLRGVLVLVNGRNMEGRTLINDHDWQRFATDMKLGIMGCFFFGGKDHATYQNDPTGDVARTINRAVEELAKQNGYLDLKSPPLIFWGHSAGANVNAAYGSRYPERVVAAINLKGPNGPGTVTQAKNGVPYLIITGGKDKPEWVKISSDNFEVGHKAHAFWTRALKPNEGHEAGKSRALMLTYLRSVIPLRLDGSSSSSSLRRLSESDGWLGNPRTYDIASYSRYQGNRSEAIWLPDESTAKAWQEFLRGQ
jgi:pimeloyl-ACP methyl ester carboxylesterase